MIDSIYYNQPLSEVKLEQLRIFTRAILENSGWIDSQILNDFYQVGYQKQHVLEIILAISFKTIGNYVNHINDTPIDSQFISGLPSNNSDKCPKTNH